MKPKNPLTKVQSAEKALTLIKENPSFKENKVIFLLDERYRDENDEEKSNWVVKTVKRLQFEKASATNGEPSYFVHLRSQGYAPTPYMIEVGGKEVEKPASNRFIMVNNPTSLKGFPMYESPKAEPKTSNK